MVLLFLLVSPPLVETACDWIIALLPSSSGSDGGGSVASFKVGLGLAGALLGPWLLWCFVPLPSMGWIAILIAVLFFFMDLFHPSSLGRVVGNTTCCILIIGAFFATSEVREYHIQSGHIAAAMNNLNTTILHYKEIVKLYPNDAEAFAELGMFLEAVGEKDQAFSLYQHVIDKLDPNNLKASVGVAQWNDRMKRPQEACRMANKVRELATRIKETLCHVPDCEFLQRYAVNYALPVASSLSQKWCK
jgi:hypothetical protein